MTSVEAERWGLISQVVANDVLGAALKLAERMTANAPLSVQASKRIPHGVDDGAVTGEQIDWARTQKEWEGLLSSADAKEGPLAFAEKRAPVWTAT